MLRIQYHCHYGALTGYGRAAHDYLLAMLRHTDAELQIVPLTRPHERFAELEPRYAELGELLRPLSGPADVAVYHTQPWSLAKIDLADTSVPAVCYTTWETTPMPEEYRMSIARFRGALTPSRFSQIAMGGVLAARVVPHTFDPDFWSVPVCHDDQPASPFRFYTLGAWGARKNTLGLLRAYFAAFAADDDVQLIICCPDASQPAIDALALSSGVPKKELPAYQIVRELLHEDAHRDMHRHGDCFVSATRGEAWGLEPFTAAVMGKRMAVPVHTGIAAYCVEPDIPDAHATPCFAEADPPIVRQTRAGIVAESQVRVPRGVSCKQVWFEPDLGKMALALRSMHHPDPWLRTRPSPGIREAFRYATVGPLLVRTLVDILENKER